MGLKNTYATDKELESDGVWTPVEAGGRVKIRRLGAPEVEKVSRRLYKPYENLTRRNKSLPEEIQKSIVVNLLTEAIVVDWDITEEEGPNAPKLPFTPEEVRRVFTEYEDFAVEVISLASSRELFKVDSDKDALKN